MNSPYMGRFKISQNYKPGVHNGIDIYGIDSKEIHATVSGVVEIARWENPENIYQGFGKYVMIREDNSKRCFIYGHLSEIKVNVGEHVNVCDVIGIEGTTGYSTGNHCHYEVRYNGINGNAMNINQISGIPNDEGGVYDDGYHEDKKSIDIEKIARDVIKGVYGNGEERRERLGELYEEVQKEVNKIVYKKEISIHEIALDVINGNYGNGEERRKRLGELYEEVQKEVNRILGY